MSAEEAAERGGKLLPAPPLVARGDKMLSFLIEKWGFKEPKYSEPYVVITLVGPDGSPIGHPQQTPVIQNQQGNYYHFGCTVHIQKSMTRLAAGSALFFEFMHYKERKSMDSCKAYCFIEYDELMGLQPGSCALEVYRKPADYSRRDKPQLLSIKPLYLHLFTTVRAA
eukprot:jgi/Astpho2/835/e_gw1.00016.277.1_t